MELRVALEDLGADEEASVYLEANGRLERHAIVECGDTASIATSPGCVWVFKTQRDAQWPR